MRIPGILTLIGAICLAQGGAAQDDMSVEEIRQAFERQLQEFKTVKTRGLGGSQSRGLKLITVEDIKTDDKGEQIVVTETAPGTGDATADTATTTATAAATPTTTTTESPVTTDTTTATATAATTTTATEDQGTETAAATSGATVTATVPATDGTSDGTATILPVATSGKDPFKPLVYGQFKPELQVNLHIEFGFDSAALDPSQKPKLQKMCIVLQTTPINKIRIVGHTDASGTDEYNERLSILRAREVARHLVDECGIAPERLETVGLGERFPLNTVDPKADENRRVEFQALS